MIYYTEIEPVICHFCHELTVRMFGSVEKYA